MSENLFFRKISHTFVLSNVGFPTLIDLTNLTRETLCREAAGLFLFVWGADREVQGPADADRNARLLGPGRMDAADRGVDGHKRTEMAAASSSEADGYGQTGSGISAVHPRKKKRLSLGLSDIFFYFCINWENNELKCRSCMTRQMH